VAASDALILNLRSQNSPQGAGRKGRTGRTGRTGQTRRSPAAKLGLMSRRVSG
jgi:hypothetical protein